MLRISTGLMLCCAIVLVAGGCESAQKTTPHMGFGWVEMKADLNRTDMVILDRVEGTSSNTSILCGLIQIIDNDKLQLFGIKFFKDKYTYYTPSWVGESQLVQVVDRAYYKALEQHPDADAVFSKSMDHESGGWPGICTTETVTFKGKAMKFKCDQKAADAK